MVLLVAVAALTLPVWKPAAKRFKWFVVATNVYQDTLRRAGLRDDQISQPDYGALPESAVPAYLHRIDSTFADYQKYGALTAERLHGAKGAGDRPRRNDRRGHPLHRRRSRPGDGERQVRPAAASGISPDGCTGRSWADSHRPSRPTPRTPCC